MEELTYHAKVIKVNKDDSILIKPVVFSEKDYPDDMLLHTKHSKMYDRFGDKLNINTLKKNQWIKFISGPKMTMSLPPQLNPTVIYEHIPMLQFKAKIIDLNKRLTLEVIDNYGSFVDGELRLDFFDEPVIFDKNKNELLLSDLQENDKLDICAIVSFFTHTPLIEIYRAEKV